MQRYYQRTRQTSSHGWHRWYRGRGAWNNKEEHEENERTGSERREGPGEGRNYLESLNIVLCRKEDIKSISKRGV
jgi:hypothetical protein